MNDKERKFLMDIKLAISLIEDFCKEIESFDQYENDIKTKSAVERQLAIIGEAVSKFKQINSTDVFSKSREIVNFRNKIIHAYDGIDDSIIWAILITHVPVLKDEVESLLNK